MKPATAQRDPLIKLRPMAFLSGLTRSSRHASSLPSLLWFSPFNLNVPTKKYYDGFLAVRMMTYNTATKPDPTQSGPLAGIRVLDMSRVLAGPFATQILGDMGAEIIKVEALTGDDTRQWGPPFAKTKSENMQPQSAYFLAINRNKKSIAINFKTPRGREIVQNLAKQSDVLVENFIPGKLDEMGFGYEELSKLNPRLIYASMTGWGPDGPFAQHPGYDVMAAATGGLMHITGYDKPTKVGVAITDICTGLYTHGAIIAALYARHTTGRGQKIDASLLETQVATLANVGQNYHTAGLKGRRLGTAHESIVPYQAFKFTDGYIIFGALNDRQFSKLANFLNMPHLASDPKFKTNRDRVAHRDELIKIISDAVAHHQKDSFLKQLESAEIPCSPINDISEVFANPQVQHRQMVRKIQHPTAGEITLTGVPVKYSDTPADIRIPPPVLAQHTDEILTQLLGYDESTLQQLEADGVILRSNLP